MKKSSQIFISEDELNSYGEEILKWGESKKLQPAELCVVLLLMHNWLKEELDIEIGDSDIITINTDDDEVH